MNTDQQARLIHDLHLTAAAWAASEADRARGIHAPFNSPHEAYAVILEELEEYWEWVKRKASERDEQAMQTELVQLAAMAIRAIADLHLSKLPLSSEPQVGDVVGVVRYGGRGKSRFVFDDEESEDEHGQG